MPAYPPTIDPFEIPFLRATSESGAAYSPVGRELSSRVVHFLRQPPAPEAEVAALGYGSY